MGGDGTVTNAGTITALGTGGVGIAAQSNAVLPAAANIINSGSITVTDGTGIGTGDFQFVLNTGVISGGAGATGILVGNDSRIDNYGTVSLMAGGTGVQLFGDRNTLNNFGTIVVAGGIGVGIGGGTGTRSLIPVRSVPQVAATTASASISRTTAVASQHGSDPCAGGSSVARHLRCGVADHRRTNNGTIDGRINLDNGASITNNGLP